jgi:hypothetical protein
VIQTSWQIYASIAKDVITAGAAITAAVVAVKGLRAWKKQLRGKTDYELAPQVPQGRIPGPLRNSDGAKPFTKQ